jgi:hypothetical protein
MPLDTYAGLQAEIADYLDKGPTLDAKIPTFIRLTESRLNKVLDDPEMEVTATATATGQFLGLPADFGELKSISVGGYRLKGATVADFSGFSTTAGIPRTYGIYDGQIAFAPVPSTGSAVSIVYARRIPALSDTNTTNWLLDQAPEAYLYGSLLAAELYLWNDERLPTFKAFFEDAIDTLRQDAAKRRWGAAPLAPRLGRT